MCHRAVSNAIEDFKAEAAAFCSLLEAQPTASASARLGALLGQLCSLSAAALRLPRDEDLLRTAEDTQPRSIPSMEDLRAIDRYWMVFDPYEPEPPIEGSLIDDLQDIYADLQQALALVQEPDQQLLEVAAAQWRFAFDVHWGRHAWSAMAALHAALQSTSELIGDGGGPDRWGGALDDGEPDT